MAELFATLRQGRHHAFSGSGVVAYTLKATGREVLANDHLHFTATLAEALVADEATTLDANEVCGPSRDGRDFIARTFEGLYFPAADHAFLDAAWSHISTFAQPEAGTGAEAWLCLAAAQKQPRACLAVTTPRYQATASSSSR